MNTKRLIALAALLSTLPMSAAWKAGVAKVVITPSEPMVLAGFAGREVPAERTAMDLYAKALAIEDEAGTKLVMVTLDLVEVPWQLRAEVCAELAKRHRLPNEALLMNCSHTHCGPELKYAELEFLGLDAERRARCLRYNAFLTRSILGIIDKALAELAPASLSHGQARCGFAMNRRTKNPKPEGEPYLNHPNPEGPVDHEVPVLVVYRPDHSLSALVFGYACHNTSLNLKQWHGDYAGHAQAMLEEAHPGSVAMFMMGCGGDQNAYPRYSPIFSQRHGQSLATAVEAALDAKPKPINGPLQLSHATTRLEYESIPTEADLQERLKTSKGYDLKWDEKRLIALRRGELRNHYDYPIQCIRFGRDLTLLALSGETCVDYSIRLKREFQGPGKLWVAGYSNDIMAYIPSQRVLKEGGYEAHRSLIYWSNPLHPNKFADSIEERIIGKAREMLK